MTFAPSPEVMQKIVSQMNPPAQVEQQKKPNLKIPMAVLGLGQGLDNLSTNMNIGHGEMNPLLPRPGWANAAMQGATTAGLLYAIHKLGPNHPAIAKALGYGLGAFGALNTANNLTGGKIYGSR